MPRLSLVSCLALGLIAVPAEVHAGSCRDRDQELVRLELVSVTVNGEEVGDLSPWSVDWLFVEAMLDRDAVELVRRGPGNHHFVASKELRRAP